MVTATSLQSTHPEPVAPARRGMPARADTGSDFSAAKPDQALPADLSNDLVSVPNSVIGKVQLILEAFGLDDASLSLSEISRRTGIPKASVHRLARELLQGGLLERRGTDYSLGMRLFEIGQRVPRGRILRSLVRPYMDDLGHATGEMVHLAIRDGADLLYLEKASPHGRDSTPSRIGGRLPLHCTATGRILLAFGPRGLFERVVAHSLERLTPYTLVSPKLLSEEVGRIRHQGYAIEQEQIRVGYTSVAVPLYGTTGAAIAALSVTAPTARANVEQYQSLLGMVSRRITRSLRSRSD